MKKIFKIVICLCLALACSVSFFACDLKKGDKFYEETNDFNKQNRRRVEARTRVIGKYMGSPHHS